MSVTYLALAVAEARIATLERNQKETSMKLTATQDNYQRALDEIAGMEAGAALLRDQLAAAMERLREVAGWIGEVMTSSDPESYLTFNDRVTQYGPTLTDGLDAAQKGQPHLK